MLNDFNPIIGSKHGSAECEVAMLKMDILINFVESMLKAFNSYEINDVQVVATEHVRYDLLKLKEKYDAIRLLYVEKYAIEKYDEKVSENIGHGKKASDFNRYMENRLKEIDDAIAEISFTGRKGAKNI